MQYSIKEMGAVTVNMVSADLSHEETILQIADALDTLDKVISMLILMITTAKN